MSKLTPVEKTPQNVAAAATVKTKNDLAKPMVVGISGPKGHRQALIRMPSGKIHSVKTGDSLILGRVAAISDTGVILEQLGKTREIGIPKP